MAERTNEHLSLFEENKEAVYFLLTKNFSKSANSI